VAARGLLSYAVLGWSSPRSARSGHLGPLGWSSVALYPLFVAGYAYFLFVRPIARSRRAAPANPAS
jgi:hypothetical protein